MDTITKWDYMEIRDTDHSIILTRPCGEISITKHPEIWQSPDQNTDMDGMEY